MKKTEKDNIANQQKFINESSFKELFFTYYSKLCRYAYYITGQKDTAEEIVQGLFTRIWESRESLIIKENSSTYLYTSVRHTAYNYYKNNRNRITRETNYSENDNNSMVFEKDIFLHKLKESLQILPDQCREIFCLKNFEGLTYKEIADYLGISEKTVDVQIYRALKKLREGLKKFKGMFYSNE